MPLTGRPSTSASPRLGAMRPETMLSRVDLPQPDGPTIDTIAPSGTSKLTSRQATTGSRPRGRNTMPTSASRIFAGACGMADGSGARQRGLPAQQPRLDQAHDGAEHPGDERERDEAREHAGGVERGGARLDHVAEALVRGEDLGDDHA